MTGPPDPPPDITWGWDNVEFGFTLSGPHGNGWTWVVWSGFEPATDLHLLLFA